MIGTSALSGWITVKVSYLGWRLLIALLLTDHLEKCIIHFQFIQRPEFNLNSFLFVFKKSL